MFLADMVKLNKSLRLPMEFPVSVILDGLKILKPISNFGAVLRMMKAQKAKEFGLKLWTSPVDWKSLGVKQRSSTAATQ